MRITPPQQAFLCNFMRGERYIKKQRHPDAGVTGYIVFLVSLPGSVASDKNFYHYPMGGDMETEREREVISRVLAGEREAYALLVDEYKTPIFNLAYRMTGSYEDASDLAQETFLRAYVNLKKFKAGRRFYTWLYTIGLNIIRNNLQKRETLRRFKAISLFRGRRDGNAGNQEEELLEKERKEKLQQALLKLPHGQRAVLILRFYQGLSFAEIGSISGHSERAVKMRAYRGLEKLRLLMNKL